MDQNPSPAEAARRALVRLGPLKHVEVYRPRHDRWDLWARFVTPDKATEIAQQIEAEGHQARIIPANL